MQNKGQAQVCPFCGTREGTPPQAPHYLKPGTILAGKYLVGKGLGHGGFGTTYLARDQVLGIKLAIKEYLPQDCASRQPGSALVTPYSGDGEQRFAEGLESFLQEARTLARFDGSPNIVGVRDFFKENGTAYLVMNYLEGITLKQYLVRSGGKPVAFEKMMGVMLPVMDALRTVHTAGLLHRDISPDNIFLTTSGQVTLIDFGAARQSMNVQQSMSVILKPGYAPEEQYRTRGHQGPWTDIYALGATMYRTLTGKIPPESLERLNRDCLIPPKELGIQMPAYAEAAILKAMAVRAEDRYQSIDAFRDALMREPAVPVTPQPPVRPQDKDKAPTQRRESQHPQKAQEDPVTYPLGHKSSKKKKKGVRPAVVVTAILMALIIGIVALFFLYLTSIMDGSGMPSLNIANRPTQQQPVDPPTEEPGKPEETPVLREESEEPEETPTATPAPTPEEETPAPSPTIDPMLAPFIEGTKPSDSVQDFAPMHGRIMAVEDHGEQQIWVTGLAPASHPEMLSAMIRYNNDTETLEGGLYGYALDEVGNLRYKSLDANNEGEVVIPADCAVGDTFNGQYGNSTVFAVNYSQPIYGMDLMNAVVIKSEIGYAFYQPGKGLVLLQSGFEGGDVYYRLLSDERDDRYIYHAYVQ